MRALQQYFRPQSAAEALQIKRTLGPTAAYLGGGTDLMVHRPAHIEAVIDVRHAGMDSMRSEEDAMIVGGATLLRDAERHLATLASGMLGEALRETAPWLIRNMATLAGNIANASPAADSVPALLACDAELVLLGDTVQRVPLEDVLVGPHKTSLEDRLILEIAVPARMNGRRGLFVKMARSKSDIAQINLAVTADTQGGRLHDVRIAYGAVGPTAFRARGTESVVEGQQVNDDVLDAAVQAATEEVRPISDWRASEEYRRRMSGVLLRRALEAVAKVGEAA